MNYQGRDPNQQGQYPGSGEYSGGYVPPSQPQYEQPRQEGYQQGPTGYQQYQQPNYGQQQPPYGQAQYGQPGTGTTTIGMEQNTAAGLSYVVGWITGLIIFLMEKQNRFVRFHAMQSIIFFGGLTVVSTVLSVIPLIQCLDLLLLPFGAVIWVFLMVMAFQGKYYKLPVIGDYAERYANQITM